MKICFVCEGCYPYIAGGVSSWLHDLIKQMPENEVIIWAIGANESMKGDFAYELPENVTEVREIFLDSMLNVHRDNNRKIRLTAVQEAEIEKMFSCEDPDWDVITSTFASDGINPVDFMLDASFLRILKRVCIAKHPDLAFTDYFWATRSMFLPLLFLLHSEMPDADLYHSVSCGYAGILASAASKKYKRPYVLTEHGIYTREREEELIKAAWVNPDQKDIWISLFYMFSRCAYRSADLVTSLFQHASEVQRELGCDPDKQLVIPNGVNTDLFSAVPPKKEDGYIDVGAIVRIVPIKDIKTMLYAFARVRRSNDRVRLHILGPTTEDPEYYDECLSLRDELGLGDSVVFTGRVKTWEYLEKLDFTLLTSISEGMPLSVLEGMAAERPAVTTNVGCCGELIHGVNDNYGDAGFVVPAMHYKHIADAILKLADNPALIKIMGQNGHDRVMKYFRHDDMIKKYKAAYQTAIEINERRNG